jgi:hypothetical protein
VGDLKRIEIRKVSARPKRQSVRDDIAAPVESGEHLTPQADPNQADMVRPDVTTMPASAATNPQPTALGFDEAPAGQVDPLDQPDADPQADRRTSAKCATVLLLEQFEHGWDELACFLEKADPEELRRLLLQACLERRVQAA